MFYGFARALGSLALMATLGVLAVGCGRAVGGNQLAGIAYPVVRAPEFAGEADDWLNSKPLRIRDLRGKVVLVDFWEYTCVNCIRTFPYLVEWHRRYADKGLVIVGIHTPEFEFAKAKQNVQAAARRFGLTFPILVDSDYKNWEAYANRYWPRKYLIDKSGIVRYVHAGFRKGDEAEIDAHVADLLK